MTADDRIFISTKYADSHQHHYTTNYNSSGQRGIVYQGLTTDTMSEQMVESSFKRTRHSYQWQSMTQVFLTMADAEVNSPGEPLLLYTLQYRRMHQNLFANSKMSSPHRELLNKQHISVMLTRVALD